MLDLLLMNFYNFFININYLFSFFLFYFSLSTLSLFSLSIILLNVIYKSEVNHDSRLGKRSK